MSEDKDNQALAIWVVEQWTRCANDKILQDQKELLDKLELVWRVAAVAARSSAKDNVRSLVIGRSSQALVRSLIFLTLLRFVLDFS